MSANSVLLDETAIAAETAAAADEAPAARLSLADVARIVPASAPPAPPTLGYTLALLSTAATASFFAALYGALVLGAVWLLYEHLTTTKIGVKGEMNVRGYLVLAIILVVLILLMLRPLIARRKPVSLAVTVSREEEPVLHEFVERVARAVGAPVPARIDVDADVNASAGFRRGLRSFGGDDLVLTIGAPLVAGSTVEELAGVLAHELGHFRQGIGMRLTFVSRTLEYWFLRVASENDKWDSALDKLSWVAGPLGLYTWLLRKIFAGMHAVVSRVSRLASRRMEIDADEHELALVGGPPSVAMHRKLVLLVAAHGQALEESQRAFERGRLPDDLPSFAMAWRARLPADGARAILASALDEKTDARATHPCVRERAERAAAVPRGPLRCEQAARSILRDPAALFRAVTAKRWDEFSKGSQFVPWNGLLAEYDRSAETVKALERWSGGVLTFLALPSVSGWLAAPLPDSRSAPDELRAARTDLAACADACRKSVEMFDSADTRVVEAHRVAAVLSIRGSQKKMPEVTAMPDRTEEAVAAALAGAPAAQKSARVAIDAALDALGRRFRAGLALAAGSGEEEAIRARAAALAALGGVLDDVAALRVTLPSARDLLREKYLLRNKRADAALAALSGATVLDLHRLRTRLAQSLGGERASQLVRDGAAGEKPADTLGRASLVAQAIYAAWFEEAREMAMLLETAETRAQV